MMHGQKNIKSVSEMSNIFNNAYDDSRGILIIFLYVRF